MAAAANIYNESNPDIHQHTSDEVNSNVSPYLSVLELGLRRKEHYNQVDRV